MDTDLHCLFLVYRKAACHTQILHLFTEQMPRMHGLLLSPGTSLSQPLPPRLAGHFQRFVLTVLQLGAWGECWELASRKLQGRPPGR